MAIPGPNPAWSAQPGAGYQVNSTAISADGSVMITGTSIEESTGTDFGIYCYHTLDGSSGSLLWSDPLGAEDYEGVFWVAMSADGRYAVAGGSSVMQPGGFLRFYSVAEGAGSRQEIVTASRINEVEMSADGSAVVAVYDDRADVYARIGAEYRLLGSQAYTGCYLRTGGISADGVWIVVGGESTSGEAASSGQAGVVSILLNNQGGLQLASTFALANPVLRVVIAGAFVAASTAGGTVSLYFRVMGTVYQEAWTMSPSESVGDIYALGIVETDAGVLVGAGGNAVGSASGSGCVFVVQNANDGGSFAPQELWLQRVQYPPNPATSFDAAALYLTAADGEPTGGGETPGNFYLFDARSGALAWSEPYHTELMNWAMAINAAGTACFGGSDTGEVYYWGRPV